MCNEQFINTVLLDWATKSPNGLLADLTNEENLVSLYESLTLNGMSTSESIDIVNDVSVISEKGKHPERQAYNKNGILVTFPTPEYKARAISRGTHFEKDPRAGQSNLFGGGQQAPNKATPTGEVPGNNVASSPMDTKQSELPQSDTANQQTPPAQKELPEPGSPGTPASTPTSPPLTSTPAQGQLATEPKTTSPETPNVSKPTTPQVPVNVQKTPQEIEAEKQIIKQVMDTNDVLPTVAGVGGVGITEELKKLLRVAIEMNLTESIKFLSKQF